jgi:hypothetical protein
MKPGVASEPLVRTPVCDDLHRIVEVLAMFLQNWDRYQVGHKISHPMCIERRELLRAMHHMS